MSGSSHDDSSALVEKPEKLTPVKKRKQSAADELNTCKKSRNDTQNTLCLNEVINLGIPHVGELIFESIATHELFQFTLVSKIWKALAEKVLLKRWKGKIFDACKNGETQVVQLLLKCCNTEELGLNVKYDEDEFTSFMMACCYGHRDVVQLLLDHSETSIELNATTEDGMTAFMMACDNGHTDVVQLLVDYTSSNIDLKARDTYGMTALMLACEIGHTDVVQLLLDHSERIELNARSNSGYTALMTACQNGHKDVVQFLLDHSDRNIELNARHDNGFTAIMFACTNGHKDVIKLLLDYSEIIELNAKDLF